MARWQAYHLSAFQFQWPWERWGWTGFAGHDEASRTKVFIRDLFVRLQRLAYYDHIVKEVPEELSSLVNQAQAKPCKDLGTQVSFLSLSLSLSLLFEWMACLRDWFSVLTTDLRASPSISILIWICDVRD